MFSRLTGVSLRQGLTVQKRLFSYARPLFNSSGSERTGSGSRQYNDGARAGAEYGYTGTRIVPKLSTFYSANPHHEAHIDNLEALLRKYIKYPTVQVEERPSWLSLQEYALIGGGSRLKSTQYKQLLFMLNRLNSK